MVGGGERNDGEAGARWRFAIDRGGTFTDVVGADPEGAFHTCKLLSLSDAYEDAGIEGVRRILGLARAAPLPAQLIESIRFGTTVATNALLEGRGASVALVVTRGFADLLEIGDTARPGIFALSTEVPPRLYGPVYELGGRMGPDGEVVEALDAGEMGAVAERIRHDRVEAVAVVLMHSWRNPAHEIECEEVLRRAGLRRVFLSHRSVNLSGIVTRGRTTLVDAYLSTVMAAYFEGIKEQTRAIPVEFMQSSGALAPPGRVRGSAAIFSGPAGGVLAVGRVAEETGAAGAIGFDMGGTSTDVSRFDGGFEKVYEQRVGGMALQGDALEITTVAAGGGSILWFDGARMRVGPESAGASPGPACYGLGGPLTVTDANLVTGRISAGEFPEVFGPDGRAPLDEAAAMEEFEAMAREVSAATGRELDAIGAALGFLEIADEKMALAVREISISKGFDVRDYALVAFGGAGGQHACAIARRLGMKKVLFHPLSSLMSAYGIGLASTAERTARSVLMDYTEESHERARSVFAEMERETVPCGWEEFESVREIDLRPAGAETCITVRFGGYNETIEAFRERYERTFGFFPSGARIEAANLRLEVSRRGEYLPAYSEPPRKGRRQPGPLPEREIFYPGSQDRAATPLSARVYERATLPPGVRLKGPAVVYDDYSSLVIDPGFRGVVTENGLIEVERTGDLMVDPAQRKAGRAAAAPDPVLLEVFNNIFKGIATGMGHTLRKTAHSVNIKERLDFSCAIFDSGGSLVASAMHIPVHIGAMADTLGAVISEHGSTMRPGDAYLSNNPYKGGSHLSDLTVVRPVFMDGRLAFFTAARGHHADIGGLTPGSMPPNATEIAEEGVLFDAMLIARQGRFMEAGLRERLAGHRYPARNIEERISDIRAQMAACAQGKAGLNAAVARYGTAVVGEYMGHVQKNAEDATRRALCKFLGPDGAFAREFEDSLDDGTPIRVGIRIDGGARPPASLSAVIDFSGTGAAHARDNLNAPLPVVRSAVLYVLRAVIDEEIPLNSGCLRPVRIVVPRGSLLNPEPPAPVASGNVETSQRIVDVLLGALGVAAASQGTMNNLLFMVEGSSPYYETIAGGAGATAQRNGASGVQVHMTNTRITDPEVLEIRQDGVRLVRFSLRRGSGGDGRMRGGDGLVREILFKRPAEVTIISERRVSTPYGMDGGGCGRSGENLVRGADGEIRRLGHRAFVRLDAGESIIIKTPGGGGFGRAGA